MEQVTQTQGNLIAQTAKRLRSLVPSGKSLPEKEWRQRHRFLVGLTWFHALVVALIGLLCGYSWDFSLGALFRDRTVFHVMGEGMIVALFAFVGGRGTGSRPLDATLIGFGLMSSSAIFVHLSGGYIELHFHFFVMLIFISLYQDWIPYLLSIAYVAIHHGLVGVLRPEDVYNHAAALNAPWTWAGIHAFFVLWSCVGSAIAWRFNEIASARTKLILQSAGEGIFGVDREGKITFINGAAEEMFLLNPGENIGADIRSIIKRIGPDGGAFARDVSPLLAPLSDGIPRSGSNEIFWRSDGMNFPVDYHSAPIIEQGELAGLVITFSDVSARNRAEQSLRTSEKKFRVLAETANDAIVSSDGRGSIIYFNKTAERIFGYCAREVFGVPLALLMPEGCHDHEKQGIEQFMSTAEAEEVGKPVELVGKRKDGSEFPIELSLASWKTGDDRYFTAIIRDITERKQIHNTLAERAAALTRSNQELEQFAYVASHDLQEPLRMITGYTQLLAKRYHGKLDQDADEYITYAVDGAKRMQTLINDLLAYSRVGTRGKEFARTECEAILKTSLTNLQVAIQESGAVVTHDALPVVVCDGGQIGQLLQNLIGNAIKYRNSRAPEIHVGCKPEDDRWLFWVKDNGIGIDPEYAERIFAIFQRLHTREEYPGTGIGLAVCKKIVERHGGSIWVDSALGKGATFHFTLPISGSTVVD
jgi:PAS domain S-box-containing protein